MNQMESPDLWLGGPRPLRKHYDTRAFTTLSLLWRRKWIVATGCVLGLVLANLATVLIDKRYTAEAMVEPKLARNESPTRLPDVTPPAAVGIDAASLIETEVRLIRSHGVAQKVASRLNLANDPAFAVPESQPGRAGNLITTTLLRNLSVTNDSRSYLISIAYTAASPARAAQIANTFAEEYTRARSEAAARRDLAELAAIYGPKHPTLLRAQTTLDDIVNGTEIGSGAQILVRAVPNGLQSSPNRLLVLVGGLVGGLGLGIAIVLLWDRANAGFRTDGELAAETNLPCLGMLPKLSGADRVKSAALATEAARAITAATGLATGSPGTKVVLITSSASGEGKSLLSALLAKNFVDTDKRALIIDMSPNGGAKKQPTTSMPLEEFLNAVELGLPLVLHTSQKPWLTMLHRSSGLDVSQKLVTSPAFATFINEMRSRYDLIVIETAPVMLCADALYLGRCVDLILHVVRWSRTPRKTVAAAIQRLRNVDARVDGLILARVDREDLLRHNGMDPRDYYRRNGTAPLLLPVQEAVAKRKKRTAA